jgi:hypothetical protein
MATYPARRDVLPRALASIAPQVDRVILVLNEYGEPPGELAAFPNVEPVLPPDDLKDTGKFLPEAAPDDDVFLTDDDLVYPPDYVAHTLSAAADCALRDAVFGYHGSCLKPGFRKTGFDRQYFGMHRAQDCDILVDLIGTGTVYLKGRHLPPFAEMATARRFTDIRFARLCHAAGLPRVALRHRAAFIEELPVGESLYRSFTRNLPAEVFREVKAFARKTPGIGRPVADRAGRRPEAGA